MIGVLDMIENKATELEEQYRNDFYKGTAETETMLDEMAGIYLELLEQI